MRFHFQGFIGSNTDLLKAFQIFQVHLSMEKIIGYENLH